MFLLMDEEPNEPINVLAICCEKPIEKEKRGCKKNNGIVRKNNYIGKQTV